MGVRVACAVALTVLVAMAAGCGSSGGSSADNSGNGGTTTNGSSSSDPNSTNYDPAQTTLKAAGLEVCSETQTGTGGGLDQSSGVSATRSFMVARDCKQRKTSPDVVTVYQFTSKQALDAGVPKLKAAYPRGQVTQYGAAVILATGPNAAAFMAGIKKNLPAPS